MFFQKQYLDLVLVPCGLFIMFAYHLFLLYRYLRIPHTTVMGYENTDKRAWVERIMQQQNRDVKVPLDVISSNISAATFLASVSLTLSSLIGAWMANSTNIFRSELIYGDIRPSTMSIKYITLLICFLLAFSCFVNASRSLVHANYLLSIPQPDIPSQYVELVVIRGSHFWSLGLRALYFATVLLLWFFGPVPMFATSIGMVILLHYLDSNTDSMQKHRSLGKKTVMKKEGSLS